jgi:hypothetical protein
MKQFVTNDTYHDKTAYENGHVVPLANDHGGEELIRRCAAECGCSFETAMDAMQFYDENFSSSDLMNAGSLAKAMEAQNQKWWETLEKIGDILCSYQSRQNATDPKFIRASTRTLWLALGFPLTAGADTPAELARVMGLQNIFGQSGKATVTKMLHKFIKQLKLAKIPGARDEEARNKMRRSRKKQLGKNEQEKL